MVICFQLLKFLRCLIGDIFHQRETATIKEAQYINIAYHNIFYNFTFSFRLLALEVEVGKATLHLMTFLPLMVNVVVS